MKAKTLLYNGRIYTMAAGLVADSMATYKGMILGIGCRLEHDESFKGYDRIDLKGRTVVPGFVDAHTHFGYMAVVMGWVSLDGAKSLGECLKRIEKHVAKLPKNVWVMGYGYSPDRFKKLEYGDRYLLDKVTGGRAAFIYNKDMHSAWVNSKALEAAGIRSAYDKKGEGAIDVFPDGSPTGILREMAVYEQVLDLAPPPPAKLMEKSYKKALETAYAKGVTGVHSFDGPEAFEYFSQLAERGKLGLRINYYPRADYLSQLEKAGTTYGTGNEFLRVAGIKIFADGALGSQTAYCFNKYAGSKDNYGIATLSTAEMVRVIKRAGKLGFPCAIHAIGDRAVSEVLDAFEKAKAPKHTRHRIEHLQLVRRKDLTRLKKLGVVASMQPSHCTSDIELVRRYWGNRGRNAYIFGTVMEKGIDLAFGSDAPIEPLDPLAGIAAAVRRAQPGSRDVFYPEQRLTAYEALHGFTVGPAIACGQEHCRGQLLPGNPADYVVLSQDIMRVAPSRLYNTEVLATVLDGTCVYAARSLGW